MKNIWNMVIAGVGEIKEKLGKPVIDYDNGQVNYLEHSFDDTHILTFDFLDNAFEDSKYFSVDG